jgi:quinoprotein glucose dehydrogenase
VRWVRQTVHHDLWDMDVPAQPVLLDITGKDGQPVAGAGRPDQAGRSLRARPAHRRADHPGQGNPGARPAPIAEDFSAPTQPISDLTFCRRR